MSIFVSEHGLRALLDAVAVEPDEHDQEVLPRRMLVNLAALVDCDQLSCFELDSATRAMSWCQELVEEDSDDDEVFWAHYWDCLACCYPDLGNGFPGVTTFSDFYAGRKRLRLGMYVDYLRPAGFEHEMMTYLRLGPTRTLRFVFFRSPGPDFSQRDKDIVALLRPHLREAYRERPGLQGARGLTQRQRQLLRLVADGHTNLQIARRLAISEGTVRKHMENIFDRLGVSSRTAAVIQAFPQRTS